MAFLGFLILVFGLWCISKIPSVTESDPGHHGKNDGPYDASLSADHEYGDIVHTYDGRAAMYMDETDGWYRVQVLEDVPGFPEKSGDIIYQKKQ